MYNKIRWCCIRHDKPRNGNQLINTDYFEKRRKTQMEKSPIWRKEMVKRARNIEEEKSQNIYIYI